MTIFKYYLLMVDKALFISTNGEEISSAINNEFLPGLMTLPEGLVIRSSLPSKCLIGI